MVLKQARDRGKILSGDGDGLVVWPRGGYEDVFDFAAGQLSMRYRSPPSVSDADSF
jgi:hypothetical protein